MADCVAQGDLLVSFTCIGTITCITWSAPQTQGNLSEGSPDLIVPKPATEDESESWQTGGDTGQSQSRRAAAEDDNDGCESSERARGELG